MNILIADDSPSTLDLLKVVLDNYGHRVIAVVDGEEAVAAAVKERFDVIVTDFHMPKLSGSDVIRALRAHGNRTPVIVCSGERSRTVDNECLDAGAAALLHKPLDLEKLITFIHRLAPR